MAHGARVSGERYASGGTYKIASNAIDSDSRDWDAFSTPECVIRAGPTRSVVTAKPVLNRTDVDSRFATRSICIRSCVRRGLPPGARVGLRAPLVLASELQGDSQGG
jgi:hypothetical protein